MGLDKIVPKKTRFMEMLKRGEQVFAPCVWDCFSAKAAEAAGFRATLLSGSSVSLSMAGVPDLGIMTVDELIWATERIASISAIPLIVDFDEGYGDSPLNVYRNVERLVRAGAQGFTLDDGQGVRGWVRMIYSKREEGQHPYELYPTEKFLSKLKAAMAAIEGTDCVLIARTEVRINDGFDEAIDRCKRAQDMGAHMTMINNVRGIEEARYLHARVDGWKMYPDIGSRGGKSDADLKELLDMNYNFVTMHYLERASAYAMMDFGRHVFADQSTVYSDTFDLKLSPEERQTIMGMHFERWLDLEREFEGK